VEATLLELGDCSTTAPWFSGPLADDWAASHFFRALMLCVSGCFAGAIYPGGAGAGIWGRPPFPVPLPFPRPAVFQVLPCFDSVRPACHAMVHTLAASASVLAAPARSSFG
jgi:hypothetical protein